MRMRLSRRSESFLPLALLIPVALGRAREAVAVCVALALARLCTLCGAEGFARAAAQEVSPRRVRGAWTGALLAGVALGTAAWRWGGGICAWQFARTPETEWWTGICLTGGLLALARLNEEYLHASAQRESASLSAFVRAVLLAGGVLCGGVWIAGAAALGWLVSLVVAWAVGGCPFAVPNGAALWQMPAACVRALLYPISGLLLLAGFWRRAGAWAAAGYLLGLAMYACAATPFRRSASESGPLHLGLLLPIALLCAAAPFLPAQMRAVPALMAFAAFTGMLTNAAPTLRGALATLALSLSCLSAWLFADIAMIAAPLCAAIALALLVPDAREMALRRRARRARSRKN